MKLFMKSKLSISVLFVLIVSISCGNGSKNQSQSNQAPAVVQENTSKINDGASAGLSQILTSYYALKDALVATDMAQAREKASVLVIALKEENMGGDILILSEAIVGATDVNDQRIAFEKLSREIYAMAKKSNFGDAAIYRQYCPMAFGNTGAFWLSSNKEIMNPYFGDKMLHCGRIEETIVPD